jgi:monofunctional glycosyltransferase
LQLSSGQPENNFRSSPTFGSTAPPVLPLVKKIERWILVAVLLAVGVGVLFVYSGWSKVRQLKSKYPVIEYLDSKTPVTVHLVNERPKNWVPLDNISKVAVGAILVSEDWAFYQHKGYDPKQIQDALNESVQKHRMVRGASTITQQVIKNVFLSSEKSLKRKLKELLWAVFLEKAVGKKRILEIYFNIAEWGEGVYGIKRAAGHYFEKSPGSLNAKEGAFLAMLLPSPKKYSVSFRRKELTPYAQKTVDRILAKMAQAHFISIEEAQSYAYSALTFEKFEEPADEVIVEEIVNDRASEDVPSEPEPEPEMPSAEEVQTAE